MTTYEIQEWGYNCRWNTVMSTTTTTEDGRAVFEVVKDEGFFKPHLVTKRMKVRVPPSGELRLKKGVRVVRVEG